MNLDFITLCDAYKLDHRRQYPRGTEFIYSNLTPRSSRVPGQNEVVFFGLQYFLQHYLTDVARFTFFDRPRKEVLDKYRATLDSCFGPNNIGVEHISDLHDMGYVPLQFCALPEGAHVPLRAPMLTWENTHPEFFWVTNYIETLLSSVLWLPCTSATTAYRYRRLLDAYAAKTGGDPAFVSWQGHDFSFRGVEGPEASATSGAGHLLSFTGSDTLPAVQLLQDYYAAEGLIGGSVAATEHSVMCAGGRESELETFGRLLDLYPGGILSVVSDTWDLWKVITETLPALKDRILARGGKLVIRPDSGDPVEILTGRAPGSYRDAPTAPEKGVIELLWDIFGGTVNSRGFKMLDPHIGAIYGDSITEARAREICERLETKGFASTNVVLGIGSYTYQFVTRDTYGHAIKATWAQINGQEHFLFKDPVTDDGTKRSARGRLAVCADELGELQLRDGLTKAEQEWIDDNLLQPVWENGEFLTRWSLADVRSMVAGGGR